MKTWAWIAAASFIVVGVASVGQDEPNFISIFAASVFWIAIITILIKWLVGIAKKHPEWVSDDDEYVAPAPKNINAKTPKKTAVQRTTPKKTKPVFSKYGTVSELKPFIDIGKDGGPDIWFDIKPDREIEIEYRDASGDITRRRVTAQAIETAYNTLVLKAYCHLRQSQRSFKLENIRRLYENGREVYIADWLDDIGFTNSNRVKRRVAKTKVAALVDKMDDSALDEFIKNSTAAGV